MLPKTLIPGQMGIFKAMRFSHEGNEIPEVPESDSTGCHKAWTRTDTEGSMPPAPRILCQAN